MASKVVFQVEKEEGMVELAISFSVVDHDFIDMMGIKIDFGLSPFVWATAIPFLLALNSYAYNLPSLSSR